MLLGAVDSLLQSAGWALEPLARQVYEQAAAATRAYLGTAAFEAARRAGQITARVEAVAYALADEP